MPYSNTIEDLRAHLFDTLEALRSKTDPMDLDRAKAIVEVGRVIVESAKVEVSFLEVTGAAKSTGFLPDGDEDKPLPHRRGLVGASTPQ